jgi:hypothetical protein
LQGRKPQAGNVQERFVRCNATRSRTHENGPQINFQGVGHRVLCRRGEKRFKGHFARFSQTGAKPRRRMERWWWMPGLQGMKSQAGNAQGRKIFLPGIARMNSGRPNGCFDVVLARQKTQLIVKIAFFGV